MARKTGNLCGGCNGNFDAPGITPSKNAAGFCSDCRPDHTDHLAVAGTHHTFCGTATRDLGDTDSVKVYDALFGSNDVNCTDCARVLRDRQRRR